jgi:outer membrane protein TolC
MRRILVFFNAGVKRSIYQQLLIVTIFSLSMLVLSCPLFAQSGENVENEQKRDGKNNLQNVLHQPLTENQAIELALAQSRELESRNTNVQIAGYRFDSAGRFGNPVLRISDVSTRYYTDEFDEMRIGLRWYPPKIGELAEDKQQAQVRLWERKVSAIRYRHQLIAKVRRNYADVIMYDRLAELAEKRVSLETKRIGIIDRMVDLGIRTVVYQTKAKMWLAESKNDVTRTNQRQRNARRKLSQKTGILEDIALTIEDLPEITQDLDQLIEIAFANRPEIELVQHRIQLAETQKGLEVYKLLPWPTFIDLSYHKENKQGEDWGELRVGIKLPIFDWNRGNIKATDLAVQRKEGESDAIREGIEDEVRDAYITYSDLLLDWKNFSRDAKNMIANAKIVVEEARKHETLQADEVLEMELTIIDTEKILCEKRRNLAHALVDLYYALGIEGLEKLSQEKER